MPSARYNTESLFFPSASCYFQNSFISLRMIPAATALFSFRNVFLKNGYNISIEGKDDEEEPAFREMIRRSQIILLSSRSPLHSFAAAVQYLAF